jgi:transcription-repair coupling factor (superfamily II helicase)
MADQLRHLVDDPGLAAILGQEPEVQVPEIGRAVALTALAAAGSRPVVVVVAATVADADRLAGDLATLADQLVGTPPPAGDRSSPWRHFEVERFPAWETLPFERVSPSVETMHRRLRVLRRLSMAEGEPLVVVTTVKAILQRLVPSPARPEPFRIRLGDQMGPDVLVRRLVAMGYRREYQVEHHGEVAVRGGIVDFFPPGVVDPIRVDHFGDEIDRIVHFDVFSQRSAATLAGFEIHGCREMVATETVAERAQVLATTQPWGKEQWSRLAEREFFDGMESWLPFLFDEELSLVDLLGEDASLVLLDPTRLERRAREIATEEAELARALAVTWGLDPAAGLPRLHLGPERLFLASRSVSAWSVPNPALPAVSVDAQAVPSVAGRPDHAVVMVADLLRRGCDVTIFGESNSSMSRIRGNLAEAGLVERATSGAGSGYGSLLLRVAPLSRGVILPTARLALIAESDLTGRRQAHRAVRPRSRATAGFFDDLAPGQYVVHQHHGVARYGGLVKRAIGGAERDYLLLEYRGNDKLYVPVDQMALVTPYLGGESPALSRLGGSDWQKSRSRARAAAKGAAEELVRLYRARAVTPGHAFAPDGPWQRELEESFPFTLTVDQEKALADIWADMESARPMDRLICGDVGFGKTEIALRAVFKAVQDGRQAAVLVPTTLLAQQHFVTFAERLKPYPVRVESLSRFLTSAQAREVTAGLASGAVDVVIGTHRLLGPDVRFARLGLLVVDEEQRFGVTHKEAIKTLSNGIDVLTLAATPIPRTLELALTGIRDMSTLLTPPAERQPILTYVGPYDERAVSEAIRRELLREGQVFFVHNRVEDIEQVAAGLRSLVPEARVAVAHGQMDEGTLEKVVIDFFEREYDVLVCTTIVESGIDMPTVNTLVVDRSERLGLAQLHQLRGRVGRSGQRAYAYLFHRPGAELSEEAFERLRTIGEATELGAGFKIALRDLELRGAGNLLGGDQSGHIAAVGYDLYMRMVTDAIAQEKAAVAGQAPAEPSPVVAEIKLEVPVDAYLPESYIAREDLRLEAYRALANCSSQAAVDSLVEEWRDRFGPLPADVVALTEIARLRVLAGSLGVEQISIARALGGPPGLLLARLSPVTLKASGQVRLRRLAAKAVYRDSAGELAVPVPTGRVAIETLITLLTELAGGLGDPRSQPLES